MRYLTRAFVVAVAGAAALLCTACSTEPEQGFRFEETEETEETDELSMFDTEFVTIAPVDTQAYTETRPSAGIDETLDMPDPLEGEANFGFRSAVWLAKDPAEDSERYFMFYDDKNGKYLDQETGMGLGFTCELSQTEGTFYFGGPDDAQKASLIWLDENSVAIKWENGKSEELTYLRDNGAEELRFYSNEQLCTMALDYYETLNQYRPSMTSAVINLDETISIQLYDLVGDHISTSEWYTVDRYTGEGYDALNNPVALAAPAMTTAPGETLPSTDIAAAAETRPGETTADAAGVPVA